MSRVTECPFCGMAMLEGKPHPVPMCKGWLERKDDLDEFFRNAYESRDKVIAPMNGNWINQEIDRSENNMGALQEVNELFGGKGEQKYRYGLLLKVIPCPFCGDNMPYFVNKTVLGTDGWQMFCGTCGAYGGWGKTQEEAEKLWCGRKDIRCKTCKHQHYNYYSPGPDITCDAEGCKGFDMWEERR